MENEEDKVLTEDEQFEKDKKDGFYHPDLLPESQVESNRKSGLAYGAVVTLVGAILVFLVIGWALDKYFQTAPILLVVGIIFGTIIGFYQFIRISKEID